MRELEEGRVAARVTSWGVYAEGTRERGLQDRMEIKR